METRLNDKISFINGEGFVKWKIAQRSSLKVYLFFELGLFNLSCSCRDEMEDDSAVLKMASGWNGSTIYE